MTKVTATHLIVGDGSTPLLVEGLRKDVVLTISYAGVHNSMGVDFTLLTRMGPKAGTTKYLRNTLWIGIDNLRRSFIGNEEEVEASDEPLSPLMEADPAPTPVSLEGLEVVL